MTDPGYPGTDSVPSARLERGGSLSSKLLAGPGGDAPLNRHANTEQPVVDQHGDLFGKSLLEAQPDQVSAREFEQLGRPRPHGQQAPARLPPHPADREDRASLLDAAQVPAPTFDCARLELCVEHVDPARGHEPDGFLIIERQRAIGGRLLPLAIRQEFLDDESGRFGFPVESGEP